MITRASFFLNFWSPECNYCKEERKERKITARELHGNNLCITHAPQAPARIFRVVIDATRCNRAVAMGILNKSK